MTAAGVAAGVLKTTAKAEEFFEGFQQKLFEQLSAEAAENNAEIEAENEAESKSSSRSGGGKRRGRSGGGGGNKKEFTFDEAGEVEVNFGAFQGATIAEIYGMSKSDAEEYDYDKPGKKWLEWAEENAKSGYLRDAITRYVDGVKNGEGDSE